MDEETGALPAVGARLSQPWEGSGLFLFSRLIFLGLFFNISRAVPIYKRK